jgi:hypothetical protein
MTDLRFGWVYVVRGSKLVPIFNPPEIVGDAFVFHFDQPESGFIY